MGEHVDEEARTELSAQEIADARGPVPDPLTDPIPEDQTRLGTTALTVHELAAAEARLRHREALRAEGSVYRRATIFRRTLRALRRPR